MRTYLGADQEFFSLQVARNKKKELTLEDIASCQTNSKTKVGNIEATFGSIK